MYTSRFIQLLLILFAVSNLSVSLAQTAKPTSTGIQFIEGSLSKAKALSQASGKPLFVEVYLKGCPHCEALAPVLKEKATGDFFNLRFVNWKVEANDRESSLLQMLHKITYPEFPLFLFFDAKGTLLHVATPAEKNNRPEFIKEVISHGQKALDPQQRMASYPTRFEGGERNLNFLLDYGRFCKVTKDTNRLYEVNDALAGLMPSPQDKTSQAGFYTLQRLINDADNPLATFFFTNLGAYKAQYSTEEVKRAGESILFQTLYGKKGDTFSAERVAQFRQYMVDLGVSQQEAAARTLLKELDAYLRAGNTNGAAQRFNQYRQLSTPGAAEFAFLMRYFNDKATDASYLPEMSQWAMEGLKTVSAAPQPQKVKADIYYELARALEKMGRKNEALPYAQQALQSAQEARVNLRRHQEQIERLK